MTALTLLLCLQGVRFPSSPVSLHGPAMRLANLTPLLAEKSKFKMRVDPEMANDVVFVDVDAMPLDRLADRIAEISLGTWTDSADGPVLKHNTAKLKAKEAAEIKLRAEAYGRSQAKLAEKIAKEVEAKPRDLLEALQKHLVSPEANAAGGYEKTKTFLSQMPMDVAARKAAAVLPAADVEAIFREKRIVFTPNPNKLQRKLPAEVAAVIQETWGDLQAYGDALRAMPQEEAQAILSSNASYLRGFTQGPAAQNGTWWLTATANDNSISFALEYRGSIGALQAWESVLAVPRAGTPIDIGDETALAISPQSAKLLEAFRTADPQNAAIITMYVQDPKDPSKRYPLRYIYRRLLPRVPDLEAPLMNCVLDPERFDPLASWLSDGLTQAAGSKKKPIIAWLGDDLFPASLYAFRDKQTVKGFLTDPRIWGSYAWSETGDLISAAPVLQTVAIAKRGNRAAFGAAIRELAKEGAIREPTLLNWAASQIRRPEGQYEDFAMRVVNPMGLDLTQTYRQWTGMGILGSLSESMLQDLRSGKTLAYNGLSPALQGRLRDWTFRTSEPMWDLEFWDPDSGSARFSSLDPTFEFPNGVPSTAGLALTYRSELAYLAHYPGGKLAEPETALQSASRLWVASKPRESGSVAMPTPETFTQGEQHLYRLFFSLTPKWAMSNEFTTFAATGRRTRGFDSLPQAHRDEVNRLLKIFMGSGIGSP